MKNYYIRAEVCEGYPDYKFVLKAKTQTEALKQARNILRQDYPESFEGKYDDRFSCYEITAEQLLGQLTLN